MSSRRALSLGAAAFLASAWVAGCYQPPRGGAATWGPPGTAAPREYSCTYVASPRARSSLCFATWERCDAERQAAALDAAQASECIPRAPVSCFQLVGDTSPSMEVCAASPEDCDLWRLIDQDKNGRTGGACEWRHFRAGDPSQAPGPVGREPPQLQDR